MVNKHLDAVKLKVLLIKYYGSLIVFFPNAYFHQRFLKFVKHKPTQAVECVPTETIFRPLSGKYYIQLWTLKVFY